LKGKALGKGFLYLIKKSPGDNIFGSGLIYVYPSYFSSGFSWPDNRSWCFGKAFLAAIEKSKLLGLLDIHR
jgi:hypothetical protein